MLSLSVLASSRNDRQVSLQIALPRSPSACRRCVFVGSRNSCIADMADSGYVALDFTSVVESARLLHVEGKQTVTYEARLSEPVYGRICSSKNALPPARLTSNPTRKTAFLFGADAISSIVLRNNAYDTLLRLGMTRDYLYYEVHIYQLIFSRQNVYSLPSTNRLLYRSVPAGFFCSSRLHASAVTSWSLPRPGMA